MRSCSPTEHENADLRHAGMDCRHPGPQDASGDIRVNLDSSTPCWNDESRGRRPTEVPPAPNFSKETQSTRREEVSVKAFPLGASAMEFRVFLHQKFARPAKIFVHRSAKDAKKYCYFEPFGQAQGNSERNLS
jgi:hypothetical protein